jgi:hypothetical protein
MRILDARFKYTPSLHTNIVSTWKRFGFKPTTEAERLARQRVPPRAKHEAVGLDSRGSITQLDSARRKLRDPLPRTGNTAPASKEGT